MRPTWHLISLLVAISLPGIAQTKDTLVGTWKLVSVESRTIQGKVNPIAFGKNPTGFATFTGEGRVTLIMVDDGRQPLSVVDRVSAPMAERAKAFATFVAYAGSYSLTGDKLIFHIQAASIQNWVDTDLTRTVKFKDGQVSLATMPTQKGGVLQTIRTTWERLH